MSHRQAQFQQSIWVPILSHPILFCWPPSCGGEMENEPWSMSGLVNYRATRRSLNNRNGKYFHDLHKHGKESSRLHSSSPPGQTAANPQGTWTVLLNPACRAAHHTGILPHSLCCGSSAEVGGPCFQDGLFQLCPSFCQRSLRGFLVSRGTFLQHCPEVRLDCVGSWPQFTGLSAKLHHSIVTPSDGVTDRQSPAVFSKPKHFATLTGRKKTTTNPQPS